MFISFIKKSQLYFIISFLVMIAAGTVLLKLPLLTSEAVIDLLKVKFEEALKEM